MNANALSSKDMKPGDLVEIADKAITAAGRAGTLSDRTWLAVLVMFGMMALTVIFYWHREDQRAMSDMFRETIKANTEALVKVQVALERMERNDRRGL